MFDDQYLSTGGQLYELMTGRDRMLLDARGLLYERFKREGKPAGHACHPYDLCTALIAEEAGVIVTDGRGLPLNAPLDDDRRILDRLRERSDPPRGRACVAAIAVEAHLAYS